jgi:hypothetical protein
VLLLGERHLERVLRERPQNRADEGRSQHTHGRRSN